MLEHFTRERQRASKGIAFNLEDEDDFGQSLFKLDALDDFGLREDRGDDEASRHPETSAFLSFRLLL